MKIVIFGLQQSLTILQETIQQSLHIGLTVSIYRVLSIILK
jgi:hypothetical protein